MTTQAHPLSIGKICVLGTAILVDVTFDAPRFKPIYDKCCICYQIITWQKIRCKLNHSTLVL